VIPSFYVASGTTACRVRCFDNFAHASFYPCHPVQVPCCNLFWLRTARNLLDMFIGRALIMRAMIAYDGMASSRPLLTGTASLGVLAAAGDLTAQHLEQRHNPQGERTFDRTRFAALCTYAFVYNGPVNSKLYYIYARLFGDGSLQAAIKSTAMDQLLYMPFVAVPISFAFKDALTNRGGFDFQRCRDRVKEMWTTTIVNQWMVWVPLEFINLFWVPLRFRVTFSGFISFCWMTALSRCLNAPSPKDTERPEDRQCEAGANGSDSKKL